MQRLRRGGAAALAAALILLFGQPAVAAAPERLDTYLIAYDDAHAAMEVIGPIGPGIADQLREALNAHPETKWVHLTSPGGLVIEGRRVRDLINARRLNTYVRTACVSACTLAFIGGHQRVVRRNAVLGFHQYSNFMGDSLRDFVQNEDRSFFRGKGVSDAFVARMYEAKHSEVLSLSADDAVKERIATSVTDRFTAPPPEFFPAALAPRFRSTMGRFAPFYDTLQQYEPDSYGRSVILTYELALSGEEEAAQRAADIIGSEIVERLLPTTSNEAAQAMARALAALFADLRNGGPVQCIASLGPKRPGGSDWDFLSATTVGLVVDAYVAVLRDAHERPQAPIAGPDADRVIQEFAGTIVEDWDLDDIRFVSDPDRYPSDPARACRLLTEYFALLAGLPADVGGGYFRASAASEE